MQNTRFDREKSFLLAQKVMNKELTEWQLTVLKAVYFDGKTQTQIALECGRNRSSVCRALHRAESRLRRFLAYCA